ncbi:MAG: tyrosine-type recombinase/integrase, partial [Candidatus Hadarchaeales archaeon]
MAPKNLPQLSDTRRGKLEEYIKYMELSNFSPWTVKANVQAILTLGLQGKPYEELREGELISWMESQSKLRPESIRSYRKRKRVKAFLRWVHGCKSPRDPSPEFLRVVKEVKSQRELPKDILTPEEVQKLLSACESLRNRALVHVLYDSGARPGEVLGLRIGDVEFDEKGAAIMVRGKVGMRRLRLTESVPDLLRWLAVHPSKEDPDAWLWPGKGGPLTEERLNDILKAAALKVGLKKRIYPRLLRHTRATHMAANGLTEHQMRVHFGWSPTSKVPARYVHLSGRDVDEALARIYGEREADNRIFCPRCGLLNLPGSLYCSRCSALLSAREAVRVEEGEELLERVLQKLKELAPEALERALVESGVLQELKVVVEGHQGGAGEGTVR